MIAVMDRLRICRLPFPGIRLAPRSRNFATLFLSSTFRIAPDRVGEKQSACQLSADREKGRKPVRAISVRPCPSSGCFPPAKKGNGAKRAKKGEAERGRRPRAGGTCSTGEEGVI